MPFKFVSHKAISPQGQGSPVTQAKGVVSINEELNPSESAVTKANVPTKQGLDNGPLHPLLKPIHFVILAASIVSMKEQPGVLRGKKLAGTWQNCVPTLV